MKKIVLFDPSYGTSNMGDFIINEAIMKHMKFLFEESFLVRYSTHTPLMHTYQMIRENYISRNCRQADLKFLGGSNIFKHNLVQFELDWNINMFTNRLYRGSITIGGGVEGDWRTIKYITKSIYKSALSKDFIHSARDEATKEFLESLGVNAVNTGCPTTWSLSPEHCSQIPKHKSNKVIFTLTHIPEDRSSDQKLMNILNRNYEEVYFWVQTTEDYNYFKSLDNTESVRIVMPHLSAYKKVLEQGDIDYVGTRLHGGIYAMQHKVRSIILIVDNRARDMQKTYNINAIERDDVDRLEGMINSDFATDVKIDEEKINAWKSQFTSYADS